MRPILRKGLKTAERFSDILGFQVSQVLELKEGAVLQNADDGTIMQSAPAVRLVNQLTLFKKSLTDAGKRIEGEISVKVSIDKQNRFWMNATQWVAKKQSDSELALAVAALPD